jgi:tagatose-1,6-bisphosphate aldolase
MTTLGKYRHLSRCATPEGHFVILAIDHRANLRSALDQHAPQPTTDAAFTAFKQQVTGALAVKASGVLTDPEFGIAAGIVGGEIAPGHGLLAPLEVTHYDVDPGQRETEFIPDWSVRQIKRVGGDGVKLLLYYHPDAANAERQRTIVRRLVDECAAEDIPFFLEPITYALDPAAPLDNRALLAITVEMARVFSALGVDVLKLQFPVDAAQSRDESVWRAACRAVSDACAVPWALLSAGVDFETFALQTQIACQAGASGVIVGRAVWHEAVRLHGLERAAFLSTTGRDRIRRLRDICTAYAHSWRTRAAPPPNTPKLVAWPTDSLQ